MGQSKKLSEYLNGCYSYYNIKDVNSEYILDIVFDYTKDIENKIYKQPNIALRSITFELLDIHLHFDRYTNELEGYIKELNTIISKGPRLNEVDLEKVRILEVKRNALVEFVNLVEDAMAYMARTLLEHYSELESNKPFLDKFSKYLGPFDWLSKRVERVRSENFAKDSHDSKSSTFEETIILQTKELIRNGEVREALALLLSNMKDRTVENGLILLQSRWSYFERDKNLLLFTSEESSNVTRNNIVNDILSIIRGG
jgi:hypothetical protein